MLIGNRQIAKLFKTTAALLELHDENPFKFRSYEKAAEAVRTAGRPLAEMSENEMKGIPGLGDTLIKKIIQIRETGTFEDLDRLMQLTPPGLVELMRVKGLGGKKIHTLWKELSITSPEDLLAACEADKVAPLRGFGKKTQENILELVHFYFESKDKWLYAEAEYDAEKVLDVLQAHKGIDKVSFTGEMRRRMPIIERIDFLVRLADGFTLRDVLADTDTVLNVDGDAYSTGIMEVPVYFHLASEKEWSGQLMRTTGSGEHLELLKADTLKGANDEEEIYDSNGLPYIIPELREGRDELEIVKKYSRYDIISEEHLRGCLHNHSTYSDGSGTIENMAQYCRDLDLEYFGLTDHSKSAHYANGLKEKNVLEQMQEIDALNEKMAPFRIFKGIESDILRNGDLDYDTDILSLFDFVVASVHANQKMSEGEANKRLIKAIENPYTTILGHMTARLLLMRRGYPLDHHKVIDACAANGVAIEINANPRRLDMDWQYLHYAQQKGVVIAINPDAHDMAEIHNMKYGVYMARKGGIARENVLNAFPLKQIEAYFENKKRSRP